MKTTLELPDETFRQAKARAALRGIPMKQFVTEALEEKLRGDSSQGSPAPSPPWMRGFGALADLRDENRRLEGLIAEEFGKIEPEDEA
ncbi:MAG: hypothetical protein H7A49_10190 [Akkermansiaceae bacterium]|nr:hypothetical protein [Akkermansiaceae bacterium]MCP5544262.1 hypothetical protein [Akkermansiaceae bacterium]MCP5547014.1 hypothetical protein [Akkermansiaceae bacterium]